MDSKLRDVIRETVKETLTTMGIDASRPVDVQRDMMWLRGTRLGLEDVKRKSTVTVLGLIVAAMLGALWLGFKALVIR
jgi:hypothetical protein